MELDVPCVKHGSDKEKFTKETKDDPTLKVLKDLAVKGKQGYFWDCGILMQSMSDLLNDAIETTVVPNWVF